MATDKFDIFDVFNGLNEQRVDLDRRIIALLVDDPRGETLWLELDRVLQDMGDVVRKLSETPMTAVSHVRGKARVLIVMLGLDNNGSMKPELIAAIALSLAEDVSRAPFTLETDEV